MKKILSLLVIAGFTALVACGPSAEEKAAAEKMRQDSIQAVMDKMAADSIAAVQAENERMMQDSLAAMTAKADSMAAAAKAKPAKKPVKPKTAEEKKEEKVKEVTGGRGRK
ncbi:MAG: hypothetical protein ACO1G9_02000 [Bacteroidota bacterium]